MRPKTTGTGTTTWNFFLDKNYSATLRFLYFTANLLCGIGAMAFSHPVKVGITASHDGGNIEVLSIGEPVISGRTAKVAVSVNIKPGQFSLLDY